MHGVYANDSTHFVGPSQFNILCAVAASSAARARAGATTAAAATGTRIRKSASGGRAKGFAEEKKVLTVPSSSCSSQPESVRRCGCRSSQLKSSLVESSRLLAGLAWDGLATTDDNLRMSLNSHTAHKSCMCFMAKELPRGF